MNIRDSSQTILDRLYDEALAMVIEARNYIASGRLRSDTDPVPQAQLLASQESLRVTSRLTQVMAWLFCQRAIQTGEMSAEEALSDHFAVGGHAVCLEVRWHEDERLPAGLRSLLERSHSIYNRVLRLEDMQRRRLEAG